MRRRPLATAAALLALVPACSSGSSEQVAVEPPPAPAPVTGTPSSGPSPAPSPVPSPSPPAPAPAPAETEEPQPAEAPFQADRTRDTAEPQGRLSVVDLRFGRHEGYDRVVLELAGDGVPGWFAEYVDEPRNQGRGNRADVEGKTFLEVMVQSVRYPAEEGAQEYRGPDSIDPATAGVVAEVQTGPLYEGYQQLFVGLTSNEQPFRVFRLADPPRVVIDVQHPR